MNEHPAPSRIATCAMLLALLIALPAAASSVLDFEGPEAGTIIAGDRPDGGTETGNYFSGITIEVSNGRGGPNSAIIFDSSNPTGGDRDLGTPNQTCGGPGRGSGGESGSPGENCTPLGNILVIAENIADVSPVDGRVDDPDDEARGGTIDFYFNDPVVPESVILLDIDQESASVSLYLRGEPIVTLWSSDLGDNSVQDIDLSSYGVADRVEVYFSSSGAVGELTYEMPHTAIEDASWGGVKRLFR